MVVVFNHFSVVSLNTEKLDNDVSSLKTTTMPTDINLPKEGILYQREQYKNGRGISRRYWDYKDNQLIKYAAQKKAIADVGCGEGILLEKLKKQFRGKKLSGIDFDEENIEICKKHGLNVHFGSVYDLPLEDKSVDCVIFSEVIEHLDQPEKAVSEIKRILNKDGLLILLFPNDRIFKISRLLMLMFKEAFYNTGHVRQWTPRQIRKLLQELGFAIVIQKNLPFIFWPISLHHLVVAQKI